MACQTMRRLVVTRVLALVVKEVSGLCSLKDPSLLRKTSKEELTKFDFKSLCEEWQARAPIFHSFLLASACTKKNIAQTTWLPSMALSGSILLKQRNNQMCATANIIGILIKSSSMQVGLIFYPCKSDNFMCLHYSNDNFSYYSNDYYYYKHLISLTTYTL